jgi:hypothetical protein
VQGERVVSTLKRQIKDDEKAIILGRYGRTCFANGHVISDDEQLQFDHIHAHSLGGDSDLNNIAPMCAQHNKEKGQLSLADFRTRLKLDLFFTRHDKPTLRDLLSDMSDSKEVVAYGRVVTLAMTNGSVTIQTQDGDITHTLYECPTTRWQYFYATLPVTLIDSDDEGENSVGLQPRYLIKDKVFSLFRHFQRHPVLQPAIGRVSSSRIRVFDGQHKIAALLLNGRRLFECKIYVNPDLRLLNNTNIAAHDAYAQTRFYSSIMVLKLGAEFERDFEEFKSSESFPIKSEKTFFEYMTSRASTTMTKGQLSERFRSRLYSSVLESKDNKLDDFVSRENRGTNRKPITIDMLSKSIFKNFIFREPTSDSMAAEGYYRDDEIRNVIGLCNMLVESALGSWQHDAPADDQNRRRLSRLFGSKSMMAWSELLSDAVSARLDLHDVDDRERVFYRPLTAEQLERVRKTVQRLCAWQRWDAPRDDAIDRVLSDNKSAVKEWLRTNGLTTGYLMGAPV